MPSTKFLFWNIAGQLLTPLISDLAEEHDVDVIILAECRVEPAAMLQTLNRRAAVFHFPFSGTEGITIYTRFSSDFLKPVFESRRFSIRSLMLPARASIILAAVHLPSKLHWLSESQSYECVELARAIDQVETAVDHRRTIVVGDFNYESVLKLVWSVPWA